MTATGRPLSVRAKMSRATTLVAVPGYRSRIATSRPVAPATKYQHGSVTHEPSTNGPLRVRVSACGCSNIYTHSRTVPVKPWNRKSWMCVLFVLEVLGRGPSCKREPALSSQSARK